MKGKKCRGGNATGVKVKANSAHMDAVGKERSGGGRLKTKTNWVSNGKRSQNRGNETRIIERSTSGETKRQRQRETRWAQSQTTMKSDGVVKLFKGGKDKTIPKSVNIGSLTKVVVWIRKGDAAYQRLSNDTRK